MLLINQLIPYNFRGIFGWDNQRGSGRACIAREEESLKVVSKLCFRMKLTSGKTFTGLKAYSDNKKRKLQSIF